MLSMVELSCCMVTYPSHYNNGGDITPVYSDWSTNSKTIPVSQRTSKLQTMMSSQCTLIGQFTLKTYQTGKPQTPVYTLLDECVCQLLQVEQIHTHQTACTLVHWHNHNHNNNIMIVHGSCKPNIKTLRRGISIMNSTRLVWSHEAGFVVCL